MLACSEFAHPEEFDRQREELVEEWERDCDVSCEADPDLPPCSIEGDAVSCSLYDPTVARECLSAHRRVNRKGICSPSDSAMTSLSTICSGVYIECDAAETGETGESGGAP